MATIKGIKVGTSTITASFTDGGVTKTASVLLTVDVVSLGAIAKPADLNKYTGLEYKPTPAVTATVGGVTTTLTKDVDYTLSYSNNVNPGEFTVTATGKGNFTGTVSNYGNIPYGIITVSADNQSYTYDGYKHGVAITATTVDGSKATIKYGTTSGTYNLDTAPQITNVSESKTIYYQVSATNHTTKTGSYTLTITEQSINIPAPTKNPSEKYTGTTYYAEFGSCTGATITGYRYSDDNGTTWSNTQTSMPGLAAATTRLVQAYYTASANYTGSGWSSSATITVAAADIIVSADNQSYTYDGNKHGVAITATTVNNQTATIKYSDAVNGTYTTTVPQITNVSESKTVYYQVTAPNHNTATGSYYIGIPNTPISIPTPTSSTASTNLYTGTTAYKATFGSCTGATITGYQYSTDKTTTTASSSNPTLTYAGTIYARAYYEAGTNYTGSAWSEWATITVYPATIPVTANDQSYPYTGSAQGAPITVTTVNNQTATIKYCDTANGTYTTTIPKITNVSESKIVYYQVTAPNHTTVGGASDPKSYKLSITKIDPSYTLVGSTVAFHKTATITATSSVPGKVYWGTSSSAMTTATSTSSTDVNVTSREELGTTTIYAYFVPEDETNYNRLGSPSAYSKSAAAKVEKATDANITVTVSSNLNNNGSAQVIATKTGAEGISSFTLGYSTTPTGTIAWGAENATTISASAPGTYYIWYKFTPDGNHSNSESGKKLDPTCEIGNGKLTVTATPYIGTYDGKAHNAIVSISAKNQNGVEVTPTYTCSTDGTNYSSTVPTVTNYTAGTKVYWKAEFTGYETVTGDVTAKVNKAAQPMTISPTSKTIYNTTGYNSFTITPTSAQGTVTYSSSNTSVAEVSSTGVVTYKSAGTATITVKADGNDGHENYLEKSETCSVTCVVDSKSSYANLTGSITITQKKEFPAGGIASLTATNIGEYFDFTSTAAQVVTWTSGHTTSGTISTAWSGINVTIASLGTTATSTTTDRTISFTVTATGEGGKTLTKTVTTGKQEINALTGITMTLSKQKISYGDSVTPTTTATYTSGDSKSVTATYTSSDNTVAKVD